MTRGGRVRRRGYACDRKGLHVSPRVRAVLCATPPPNYAAYPCGTNPIETTVHWFEPLMWLATFLGGAILGGVVGVAMARKKAA